MPVFRAALALSGSYYLAAKLGFALTPPWSPFSMVWLPNALLLAALLLAPLRQWWVLIAAVLPAHLAAELQSGVPMPMTLGWYLSNCSEALMGAGAIRLVCGRPPRFNAFRDAGVFLFFGVLLAPVLSSFIDAALTTLLHWGESDYWTLVRRRIPSNALATLLVVPFVLTWAQGARLSPGTPRRYLETGIVLSGLAAASLVVFNWLEPGAGARQAPALFYAPLPFLLWAAVRLGPTGVSTANLLLAAAALWGAVHGLGPFVSGAPEDNARDMHLFLVAVTVPMLLLAALLAERRRVELETRRQRQQLAHLSRVSLLGGLSGAIAHELNQPLTAILSNTQAAQYKLAAGGDIDRGELDEILRDIAAADRRASEVISRLRALFKNSDSQQHDLDVNDVVREVLDLAHGDLTTRHVTVVQLTEEQLPMARADRIQLQQVLLNLVVNACEAMSADGAHERVLKVETRRGAHDGVQISIIDSGPGFGASAETLFEPFYTTKPHGLGLGLSISRSIISAHGGRLWGSGAPGRGAAFHVDLVGAPPGGHPTLVQ